MKRIKLLDQKCSEILKEFLIYIVFVTTLFVVTFSNLSNSSIQYNTLFQNTFVKQQTQNEIGLYDVRIIFLIRTLRTIIRMFNPIFLRFKILLIFGHGPRIN